MKFCSFFSLGAQKSKFTVVKRHHVIDTFTAIVTRQDYQSSQIEFYFVVYILNKFALKLLGPP